ncbi:MAG TPA: DUF3006 domain-containing protein [Patescibacteria group bacterium]|nr:DUF3006 domain-containing protein [Patescibacteria group bacterium]
MKKNIKTVIDRIEANKVILLDDKNEKIIINKNKVPQDCQEGDVVFLNIKKEEEKTRELENSAKELLNKILNKKT